MAMTCDDVLYRIGGQPAVRAYLRGVEEGSEMDQDAQRAVLAAIESMKASGVYYSMADACPELYAQAVLLTARMWTDAEDSAAAAIQAQADRLTLQLRYDERNVKE